jgi:hypothetical protein
MRDSFLLTNSIWQSLLRPQVGIVTAPSNGYFVIVIEEKAATGVANTEAAATGKQERENLPANKGEAAATGSTAIGRAVMAAEAK